MKKFLLSAALLGTALSANAQEMLTANFETTDYTLGNFVTGIYGAAATPQQDFECQGLFWGYSYGITFSTVDPYPALTAADMDATRFQIEQDASTNASQVLRFSGWPMAASSTTPAPVVKENLLYAGFETEWSGDAGDATATPPVDPTPKTRLDGNDIAELDFDFWIPAASTSKNYMYVRLANNKNQYITGASFTTSSNTLRGFNYTSANKLSNITGGSTTTLAKGSWQHVTVTYNTLNGEVRQKLGSFTLPTTTTANKLTPAYVEIYINSGAATTAATPATDFKIDNIVITATPTSTLGTKEIYRENNDVAVYLNHNQLEISSKIAVEALEVYNLAGQLVASQANSNSIDVSALGKGTYVAKYQDKKQTYSKRFIK